MDTVALWISAVPSPWLTKVPRLGLPNQMSKDSRHHSASCLKHMIRTDPSFFSPPVLENPCSLTASFLLPLQPPPALYLLGYVLSDAFFSPLRILPSALLFTSSTSRHSGLAVSSSRSEFSLSPCLTKQQKAAKKIKPSPANVSLRQTSPLPDVSSARRLLRPTFPPPNVPFTAVAGIWRHLRYAGRPRLITEPRPRP